MNSLASCLNRRIICEIFWINRICVLRKGSIDCEIVSKSRKVCEIVSRKVSNIFNVAVLQV